MDLMIRPLEDNVRKKLLSSEKQVDINVDKFLDLVKGGHFKGTSIHEVLENCELNFHVPQPEPRSAELEERITRLKAEQANAEYRSMTKNITSPGHNNENLREDISSLNSHIAVVINFVFAVLGSFFFAFKAVEYALPEPNIPGQVLMGIITSTVVALADLFFILRTV